MLYYIWTLQVLYVSASYRIFNSFFHLYPLLSRLLNDVKYYNVEKQGLLKKLAQVGDSDASQKKLINNQLDETDLATQDCISRATTAQNELYIALQNFPVDKDSNGALDKAKAVYARSSELGLKTNDKFLPASTTAPTPAPAPAPAPASESKSSSSSSSSSSSASTGLPRQERTFVAIKPDAVQRGLVGKIITRFEEKGFKLIGLKQLRPTVEQASKHYAEHEGKAFFPGLVKFFTSGPIVAMVWEGLNAVKTVRAMCGTTNPADSAPGTIRGDYGLFTGRNVIHSSDSVATAQKEIQLWLGQDIVEWDSVLEQQLYE